MSKVRESYGFPLSAAIHTDVGRVRTNNEDSSGQTWLPDGSLFVIVADGMGGHEAGEVASGLAVQVAEEGVAREPGGDPRDRLYNALLEANESILEEGRRSGKAGMGTTAVCALIRGEEVTVALVGDSRCYHIRSGNLVWRTVDHTRVQMLVDQGEITEEESRTHPEAGMLTRALGHGRMADGRPLVPDVIAEPLHLQADDTLVFCSDGLHDLIEDWEIGREVAGRSAQEAAEALVNLACDRGGHDNVTVAVVIAGKKAGEYDPDFVPPKQQTEATYMGDEPDIAPPPAAYAAAPQAAPAPPAKSGGSSMMIIVGVVVVLLLLGVVGFVAMVALGGLAFFLT